MRALHPILRHSSGTEDAHTAPKTEKFLYIPHPKTREVTHIKNL
ncbi:hypothetical protein LEP1GSC161_0916 [Leptospira santarosai str. CBC1416]|uniref:Uncharacterized protein n=1 Tax=Leptospira santarosai str. CBC1416 TaxID=1193059 RepID=M6W4M3_9LEPT|nr:hypothetical protein LEP1GSC161_0916 [Leptospira santarosai str. CBC1416]